MTIDQAVRELCREYYKAVEKHAPMTSEREGHSVIEEEYDEFWDAIKQDNSIQARHEVTQLGAMCLRFLIDTDKRLL